MSIVSNLYPPIVPDTLAAFIRTQTCRIYFSLSIYNEATDIRNVQISLINQATNASILNPTKYPSGIKLAELMYDSTAQGDYKYYVEIIPDVDTTDSDIIGSSFEVNQYYIAQLRFTSIMVNQQTIPNTGDGLDTWLYENREYFSEWSTMCLIKGIDQPLISINSLDAAAATTLSNPLTKIIGRLYYENGSNEREYLKSYNIAILTGTTSVFKTDEIYTNQYNPNQFNYEIIYNLQRGVNYTLTFTYTTNNLYSQSIDYDFIISAQSTEELEATIALTSEDDEGRIKFEINFEDGTSTDNNLIIRRTSSKTNFTIWENIKTLEHDSSKIKHTWYDTAIESGIWYKYRVEEDVSSGTSKVLESSPILCLLEDMFITSGDKQLKIRFNPSVSEFKYNVVESQQNTLGSKFPYVKRNGNNYFRSFNISGLIASFMDSDDEYNPNFYDSEFHDSTRAEPFTSPDEIYGNSKNLYSEYNISHSINKYGDFIYEREFRQKVMDFLYNNTIKLFRSTTEGNILVKLMNISFQPMNELGRMLYSFSASAVEIADFNIENCKKYNIINQKDYSEEAS